MSPRAGRPSLSSLSALSWSPGGLGAQARVKFALDWQIQGPQAPFITAKATGAFAGRAWT